MQILNQYFLVKIDKQSQNKKRSKVGSIYIPENFQDMAYNLQYGEVVAIGHKAAKEFPQAEIGDILIFHHHVEYKPRVAGDNTYQDTHLVETLDNFDEIRTVDISYEVFGVIKTETQTIIPFRNFVFCHEEFKPASFQQTSSGIYMPDAWEASQQQMVDKLEELKMEIDNLRSSNQYQNVAANQGEILQIEKTIASINKEREEITRKMNKERYMELTLLYINEETISYFGEDVKAGDKVFAHSFALYPLDIDGVHFTIINTDYIALIKTENMKEFIPLHNRVLVIPDEKEKKTKGGIIVPDTVKNTPNQGKVYASGPGYKGVETTVKAGDKVMYQKNAGTEIEIEGKSYLLMREEDIFGIIK